MDKWHTFKLEERVEVIPESRNRTTSLKTLSRETSLEIRDYTSVAPGEQELNQHHQRVKVGVVGESWTSDWFSGGHFRPLS